MINSISNNAVNLINSANNKAASAAGQIARLPVETSQGFDTDTLTRSAVQLLEAKTEAAASAKLIETDQTTKGSILDISA